ncbi:hypothetical protein [Litorihabitans aurantiacus]|uniref:Uncharacterized protein n=1 Tax=Litorihabitans aurantiacus TaxID=1930061 RepID=A0AA37XG95_9MICO|nr:hypothetical protein [Litorihabitans aurantiacus]GMA32362.1 hypothetical protein GCM10025875_23540 [Litorihabitans aurantiacus]
MATTSTSPSPADAVTTYSVLTPTGRRDVVLAGAVTVADLLRAVDLPPGAALLTSGGLVLHADDDLERLAGGEVLVVGTSPAGGRSDRPGRERREDRDDPDRDDDERDRAQAGGRGGDAPGRAAALWTVAGAAAGLALVRAADLVGPGSSRADVASPSTLTLVCALLAGALALVLALAGPTRGRSATATTTAAWACGAAAGLIAVPADLVGDPAVSPLLVPLVVALLAAAAATAVRYARLRGGRAAVVAGVLLAFTTALAVSGAVAVVTESGLVAACAVLLGLAPIVARALPARSLDVPDHVVLDLAPAQRTATSVRERAVVSPPFVRGRTVERSVATAQARRGAAAVLLGVVVTLLAPVVLLAPLPTGEGWPAAVQLWATGALGVAVAGALVAIPRGERLAAARLGPRLAAGVTAVLTVAWFARVLDAGALPAALVLVAAALTVATAFALGRGWRSVRASRVTDALESLAVAFAPSLGLLAAGVLAWLRLLASG